MEVTEDIFILQHKGVSVLDMFVYIKEWIKRVTLWIRSFGMVKEGSFGNAIYYATETEPWTAFCNGLMIIMSNTTNTDAYWKVYDATDTSIGNCVACASKQGTPIIEVSAIFPIIKGHKYYSQTSGLEQPVSGSVYRIGGNTMI